MAEERAGAIDVAWLEGRRTRRWLARIGLPILGVAVVIAALLGIAAYSYVTNKRDALTLADEVMIAQEQRAISEVAEFLAPPERSVDLLVNVIGVEGFRGDRRPIAEIFAMRLLRKLPQIANISYADLAGNYMLVRREPDGRIDTKVMEREGASVRTTWTRRDPGDAVVAIEEDPNDTYDPRTRPWFKGAVDNNFLSWSDIYVFFTDRKLGITVSQPVYDEQKRIAAVYGVDMTLDSLGRFLASVQIGKTGRAMIIDGQGRVIAHPDPAKAVREVGDTLVPVRLDELGDPVLTRVFNIFRVEGRGRRLVEVDGERFVTSVKPLYADDEAGWSVLMVVPESDFVGFVALNNRSVLAMSLAVIALVAAFAALLIRQGLRADRNAQLVMARERVREVQSAAFAELAADAALFDPGREDAALKLTRTLARAVGARRAGLWLLGGDGARLVCEACYEAESDGHTAGTELRRADLPELFAALAEGAEFDIADAARDPRTAALHRLYLSPVGSRALLSVPVRSGGAVAGAVWAEDARAEGSLSFARAVANMVAVRLGAAAGRGAAVREAGEARVARAVGGEPRRGGIAAPEAMRSAGLTLDRGKSFLARLAAQGLSADGLAARVFRDTTVMNLRFTDAISLAERAGADGACLADRLARTLEEVVAATGIDYAKVMGEQIVVAAGFGADPHAHAAMVAETALAMQDMSARLFTDLGRRLEFRMGIDTGTVIGSAVGAEGQNFNLWGEASRTAGLLAESAPAGAIQCSETAYRLLRDGFLFRSRGAFYVDRAGELSTYLLTGRT